MHSPFFLLAGSVLQHAHHRLQRARRASQPCAALWTRTCTPIKNDRNTPDYLFIYNLLLWFKPLFWILWNGITCWRRPAVCSNWGVFSHVHAGDRREAHCRQGDVLFNGLDYILYGFFFFHLLSQSPFFIYLPAILHGLICIWSSAGQITVYLCTALLRGSRSGPTTHTEAPQVVFTKKDKRAAHQSNLIS